MTEHLKIQNSTPPDFSSGAEQVYLMRDDVVRIRKNYKGMLYFCSRITGIPEEQITMIALKQFEMVRFHEAQQAMKNCSFPVQWYLDKIKELESTLSRMTVERDVALRTVDRLAKHIKNLQEYIKAADETMLQQDSERPQPNDPETVGVGE